MELFQDYTTGIIVVSVLAILLENILPETHHKKYINVTIGLVVMLVIIKPLTGLGEWRTTFVLPDTVVDDSDLSENADRQLVIKEFQERLASTLSVQVENSCGKKVEISVLADVNENGEITGIRKVSANPLDDEIRGVIAENAGILPEIIEEGNIE